MAPVGHINKKQLTVLLVRRVLQHPTKNIERQYLFQPFGKIKIAGSYEDKPSLDLGKLRRWLSFVSPEAVAQRCSVKKMFL